MNRLTIGGISPAEDPAYQQPRLLQASAGGPVRVSGRIVYPSVTAATAEIRRQVQDLSRMQREQHDIDRRLHRMRERLADPAYFEHPRRAEAEERYEKLTIERGAIGWRMQSSMLLTGDIFLALPEDARLALQEAGWPPVRSRIAMRVFLESCLATRSMPGEEAPF